jgi:hypothetical protein
MTFHLKTSFLFISLRQRDIKSNNSVQSPIKNKYLRTKCETLKQKYFYNKNLRFIRAKTFKTFIISNKNKKKTLFVILYKCIIRYLNL